ncbi:hypothetical protein SUGI_0254090 [Cryptomeria japonica]|uniref:transcription factor MYB20 n=1 Tax=Cryptomeria japonica TaxID=3369 RepID=UPI002408A410|nr:transcription factor MYB20 [Cryptomeria japonica]GLJ15479.1 hypothetical protein SUGI_0254090 [Cryptomeria japonica]
MGRQPCCDKVGVKKGPWTAEEDRKLVDFLANNGHCCWRTVPKLAGLSRCGKSCRLRWTNYLRPDLKRGVLSDMEEKLIIELHSHLGNRWAKIAAHLPGRTDNEIKNYWNTHIKKKLRRMGIDPVTHQPLADAQLAGEAVKAEIPDVSSGETKEVTESNVQCLAVKLEAMSTSGSTTNHSEMFEDDKGSVETSDYKIPPRFGFDAVSIFNGGTGSNPGASFAREMTSSWECNGTMLPEKEHGAPLMLQGDEGLWELGDFIGSNLSLEAASVEGLVPSSCNASAALETPELKWENSHQVAVPHHMDMLIAGSILTPYEANPQLWAQGIYPFSPWEGVNAMNSSSQPLE